MYAAHYFRHLIITFLQFLITQLAHTTEGLITVLKINVRSSLWFIFLFLTLHTIHYTGTVLRTHNGSFREIIARLEIHRQLPLGFRPSRSPKKFLTRPNSPDMPSLLPVALPEETSDSVFPNTYGTPSMMLIVKLATFPGGSRITWFPTWINDSLVTDGSFRNVSKGTSRRPRLMVRPLMTVPLSTMALVFRRFPMEMFAMTGRSVVEELLELEEPDPLLLLVVGRR